METIKEETGADGRKKIYVRYTEQELAEMKEAAKKSGKKGFLKRVSEKS